MIGREDDWAVKADSLSLTYRTGSLIKERFEHSVLSNVSFSINTGETFGVLGRNGCGKSSLLKVLAGVIKPDAGELILNNIKSRALLSIGLGFNVDLSGRDNALLSLILQGISKKEARKILPKIAEFSELNEYFEQPVRTYSAGMRSRLGFSTAIEGEADLLLVDETLSVGDQHFRNKAEKAMMSRINGEQTVVFVSHNAEQVKRLCQNAIWISGGEVAAIGEVGKVVQEYTSYMKGLDVV